MSSSNCCFLTCIQISQETGQVIWYSHLFENFPQLIVIHTIKGFDLVNKAKVDVFLELPCFFDDPVDVGNSVLYCAHLCMKFSLGISNFLEEISSLSHSIVFLYVFATITEEGFLVSSCYTLEICIQMGISYLFSFAFRFSFLRYL